MLLLDVQMLRAYCGESGYQKEVCATEIEKLLVGQQRNEKQAPELGMGVRDLHLALFWQIDGMPGSFLDKLIIIPDVGTMRPEKLCMRQVRLPNRKLSLRVHYTQVCSSTHNYRNVPGTGNPLTSVVSNILSHYPAATPKHQILLPDNIFSKAWPWHLN